MQMSIPLTATPYSQQLGSEMSLIDIISNRGQRLLARVDADRERVEEVIQEIEDRAMPDIAPAKPLTPDEFMEKIEVIMERNADCHGDCHWKTDDLMEELLIKLGYKAGVGVIRSLTRFYD